MAGISHEIVRVPYHFHRGAPAAPDKVKNVWNIPLIPLEKLQKCAKLHKIDNIFSTFILRFGGRHSPHFVL